MSQQKSKPGVVLTTSGPLLSKSAQQKLAAPNWGQVGRGALAGAAGHAGMMAAPAVGLPAAAVALPAAAVAGVGYGIHRGVQAIRRGAVRGAEEIGGAKALHKEFLNAIKGAANPQDLAGFVARHQQILDGIPAKASRAMKNELSQAEAAAYRRIAETPAAAVGGALPGQALTRGQAVRQFAGAYPGTTAALGVGAAGVGGLALGSALSGGGGGGGGRRDGRGMVIMGSEYEEKTAMDKEALRPWMKALGLAGLGGAAGAAGGFAAGKRHYEPAVMSVAHPQTGEYMGDMIGGRDAMEDLHEELSGADSYESIQAALAEAENRGVVFKGASDRTAEKYAAAGQIMARSFTRTLSKNASVCLAALVKAGWVAPEDARGFAYTNDFSKMASLIALTSAASTVETDLTKQAFLGEAVKFIGKGLSGWGRRLGEAGAARSARSAALKAGDKPGAGFFRTLAGGTGKGTGSRFNTEELVTGLGALGGAGVLTAL